MSQSSNLEQLLLRSKQALKEKDFSDSVKYLKKALKINAENPEVLELMGLSLFNLAKYDEALHYLQKISTYRKTDFSYWNLIGETHYHLRNYKQALDAYKKVLKLDPDSATIDTVTAHIETLILKIDYSKVSD